MTDDRVRYVRGVDEMPDGDYQQNEDGTWSEAVPLAYTERGLGMRRVLTLTAGWLLIVVGFAMIIVSIASAF